MWACCQPGELPQAQGCFYFLGQETSLHGLFKIFLLFIFFFLCESQRPLLVHWGLELWVELHNTTLTMSCWLLSPFLDGSLLESFPGILFTCQKALGFILAEGFIYDKPDKRPPSLTPLTVLVPGLRAERQGQWGFSLLLPPAAQADSQLEGPHADHQGRAC